MNPTDVIVRSASPYGATDVALTTQTLPAAAAPATHDTTGSRRFTAPPMRVRGTSRHRIRLRCVIGPARIAGASTVHLPVSLAGTPVARTASAHGITARVRVLNPRTEADDDLSLLLLLGAIR